MPLAVLFSCSAKRYPVIDQTVITDHCRFPDHNTRAMVNDQTFSDLRTRMNLNIRPEAADIREKRAKKNKCQR